MAAIVLMAAMVAWAVTTHRVSYVVTHGVSMNPVYYQGDLVFVVKSRSYKIGQIAAYHGANQGVEALHRIVGGDPVNGFVFKGDNNRSIDGLRPKADQVIGRAVLHVPKGGFWLQPLLSPTGLGMLGFMIIGGGPAGKPTRRQLPRGRRKKRVKAMSRQGGSWTTAAAVAKAVVRLPPALRAMAVLVAIAALGAVTLGTAGWFKPVLTVRKPDMSAVQSVTFSYSAAVPHSAAYDGTKVTSPDPIFRKLTHLVDVHVLYHGDPGTFDASITLSASSGWHSTVATTPAAKFSGATYQATIALNLDDLDARAQAAARIIGAELDQVAVTVNVRFRVAGKADFTAPLGLTMTPLELALATGKSWSQGGGAPPPVSVVRQIELFGHPLLTGAHARAWSGLLLAVALFGAAVIALLTRRNAAARTRAEIERRFPQLLVHVEPMASPPGKPVVNVDNFPALVKLAERYGQMILTWRRPDADDFVVRDEGITYRYRVPLDEPHLQNVEHVDRPPGAGNHRRRAASEVS